MQAVAPVILKSITKSLAWITVSKNQIDFFMRKFLKYDMLRKSIQVFVFKQVPNINSKKRSLYYHLGELHQ